MEEPRLLQSSVGLIKTSPNTVLQDYSYLMRSLNYTKYLPKDKKIILKLNLSWSLYFPACSTQPWQLEGILKTLKEDGYTDVVAVENKTVVTNPLEGAKNNKWSPVLKKYGIDYIPLDQAKWVEYKPKNKLLVLDKIFNKIEIPELFIGNSVIHPPTLKTHGHTMMTGAMKNAFGGLLREVRHHCHRHIHEVLVDLLTIQKEIHSGLFAVMDGTVYGDGAGPRTMFPKIANLLLASNDMVAIDAVASKIMGFEPFEIRKIRLAHEMGLGNGEIEKINVVGLEHSKINLECTTKKSPVIFFDQLLRSSFIEPLLFRTWFFNLCILGSESYHDWFWYPLEGRKRIKKFKETEWGRLFDRY
ncbi:MAG: DUF362 domain-containing protein [Nitrososphaerales archaeon]